MISRLLIAICFLVFILQSGIAQDFDLTNLDSLELRYYDADSIQIVFRNKNTEKYGCISHKGDLIIPFEYDYLGQSLEGLRLAVLNSKYGYLNAAGETQIEFQYISGTGFLNGKAIVANKEGFGVIDQNNKLVLPFEYGHLKTKDHVCYAFKNIGGKFGVMDSEKNIIIEEVYDAIMQSNDSFWLAMENLKFDIFKYNGEKHLNERFDRIGRKNSYGYTSVGVDGKNGMLDEHFNWAIPPKYEKVSTLFEERFGVKDSTGWKVFNAQHEQVIDEVFEKISYLNKTHSIIRQDGRDNIIDFVGKRIIDPAPQSITKISGGKLMLKIDEYLYDGLTLHKIFEEKVVFTSRSPRFSDGYLALEVGGKCAIIDTSASFIISPQYDYCENLIFAGYLKVKNNDSENWGVVNLENELVIPFEYKNIDYLGGTKSDARFWLDDENSKSYFAKQQILISDIDSIVGYMADYTFFKKNDEIGFVNTYSDH